ncbi:MAG: PIN domain-containing protein [Candidatus Bathyarchaeia archaeon]
MNNYVVDAWAWVEYLIGSKRGEQLRRILDEEDNEVYTCTITIAEVVGKAAREKQDVEAAYTTLVDNSQIVNINEELSKQAGLLHAEVRQIERDFSITDAYVLAAARKLGARILTGDAHFKNLKEAVFIE